MTNIFDNNINNSTDHIKKLPTILQCILAEISSFAHCAANYKGFLVEFNTKCKIIQG